MTVSIRIAGKLVYVSNTPPRAPLFDVGSSALLRRVRLDGAGVQALRSMLALEMGSAVPRMSDAVVVEEAAKRVAGGRWTLSVLDVPKLLVSGTQGGADSSAGKGGEAVSGSSSGNDPLKDKKKTWVEFDLLDKNKRPVRGLNVEVTLPDGTIEKGTLSEKGSFRKDGIDPGTCRVRFPDLCGREWGKAGSFAEGAAVTLVKGTPKIGAGPYPVMQGDHIASITADAGYLSWKTIWDDGGNAALKAKRNPNVLYPGDILEIPAKQKKEESIPTTEYSTFQTIGDPVQLKIVVLDWAGNPVVDTEMDIQLDAAEKIKTAGDGSATKKVLDPLGIKEGRLTVKGFGLALKVGHLDPVEEISGQVARLNNLGYRASSGGGAAGTAGGSGGAAGGASGGGASGASGAGAGAGGAAGGGAAGAGGSGAGAGGAAGGGASGASGAGAGAGGAAGGGAAGAGGSGAGAGGAAGGGASGAGGSGAGAGGAAGGGASGASGAGAGAGGAAGGGASGAGGSGAGAGGAAGGGASGAGGSGAGAGGAAGGGAAGAGGSGAGAGGAAGGGAAGAGGSGAGAGGGAAGAGGAGAGAGGAAGGGAAGASGAGAGAGGAAGGGAAGAGGSGAGAGGAAAGASVSPNDPAFKSAVEEFQCDYGLTVDGACGAKTQAKLRDVHGS